VSAPITVPAFNRRGVWAIYRFELARFGRTLWTSLFTPVITTSLYFIVFGAAIGSRMGTVDGVSYGAFIVPGLIMLSLLAESIGNSSFGIYFPRWTGSIYEVLSAPLSPFETVLAYVFTATFFVDLHIAHPYWMIGFLLLTAVSFCLFGFILGVWASSWEQLQVIPLLVVTPLTFLGGAFYSIDMLPGNWKTIALFNPIVYLISGFRWSFFNTSDVGVGISLAAVVGFLLLCLGIVWWIFRTGYRLKN
jgi:ABC-2 type transport system permease protein